jgi:hypothetical protein
MRQPLHLLVFLALALILAAQAAAASPTRVEEHVDRTRTIPAGALCPFDFVVTSEGHRTTTTFTNADGSLDRFTIHLTSWHTTYTNPANGKMLRVTFSGPVIVEALPDGRALVRIPGNDPHIVNPGEGPVYTDSGLIVYIAPDVLNWEEQLEVLHVAGGRRESEDFVAAVCGALA